MPFTGANIASAYGGTANYWKIGQLYIDYNTNTGFINYLGFESETKAYAYKTPLKTLEIRLEPADITGVFGSAIAGTGVAGGMTLTGANIIDFYDLKISSESKNTILKNKTKVNYPVAFPEGLLGDGPFGGGG
jgi:hypothetical protein